RGGRVDDVELLAEDSGELSTAQAERKRGYGREDEGERERGPGGGLRPSIASLADEIPDSSHGAERDPERHHEAQAREAADDAVGGERLRPRLRDPAGEDACRLKGPYLGRELERDGYAEGEDAPIAR